MKTLDGKPIYEGVLLGSGNQKGTEYFLRESDAKYRDLLNNLPQKVFHKNTDLVYVYCNPSYAQGFTLQPEDLIGKTDYDLYPTALAEKYRAEDFRIIETGIPTEFDEDYLEQGELRNVHTVKIPIRDPQGRITGILGIFWDITERKRMEMALTTSQVQHTNAVHIAHLGPWEYDVNTDQFTFNDHFYALFRTAVEREGGYCMSSAQYAERFLYPEDAHLVAQEIQKALESSDPYYSRELEHRILYADGEVGYLDVRFMTIKDETGKTVKAFGANQDITDRKRVETIQEALQDEIRRHKDLLERILQETPAAIAILSVPDYRYILVNPEYYEIMCDQDEILGRTVAEVCPEAYHLQKPLLDYTCQTGKSFHGADLPLTPICQSGQEPVYFSFTYTPLMDTQGKVESILLTAQETTDQINNRRRLEKELSERKRIEAELRDSEQRYEGIFEDSPVSLWEEDFSEVKSYLGDLRRMGVTDFPAYLNEHPEEVIHCLSRVRVVDVNQEAVKMYQAENKGQLLAHFDRIFPTESYALFRHEILAIARGQRIFESEGKNSTLSGELIDIYLRFSVAPGHEDTLTRVFISILDITARKKAEALVEKQVAQTEALARVANALSAASLDAGMIYETIVTQTAALIGDACLLTLVVENQTQAQIVAFSHVDPTQISGMRKVLPTSSIPLGEGQFSQVVKTGKACIIPVLRREDIDQVQEPGYPSLLAHFEVNSLLIVPLNVQGKVIGTLGVIRDRPGVPYTLEELSLLRYLANQASFPILNSQLYEQIKRQAQLDPLTGISNRRHFAESAEKEFHRAQRYQRNLSVIMIDVDHFKEINDTYGHEIGDQLLLGIVDRFRACVRRFDVIGRYAGDEFLILLPETDLSGAAALAERVRSSIVNSPLILEGISPLISVSLGVASLVEKTQDLTQLLRQADQAMYVAKRAGRNQVKVFEPGIARSAGGQPQP